MTDEHLTSHDLIAQLSPLCQGIDNEVLRDFVSRMDPEYFTQVEVETVAQHLRLIAALTLDHPCELSIRSREGGRFEITVVAYDYFSEFATICGLLSTFGLNIEEGRIYTFAEASSSAQKTVRTPWPAKRPKVTPGLSRKKIVDVFVLHPASDHPFTPSHQAQLRKELTGMIRLLDTGNFEEARQHVNRRLIEQLAKRRNVVYRFAPYRPHHL